MSRVTMDLIKQSNAHEEAKAAAEKGDEIAPKKEVVKKAAAKKSVKKRAKAKR